jgi:hypothetical protein
MFTTNGWSICERKQGVVSHSEGAGEARATERTSSSSRRSWMMFATDFWRMHRALSMYLSAYSFLVCLCSTTRTCAERYREAYDQQEDRRRRLEACAAW